MYLNYWSLISQLIVWLIATNGVLSGDFCADFFFCKELSRDEQNMIKSQHAGHTCLVSTSCESVTFLNLEYQIYNNAFQPACIFAWVDDTIFYPRFCLVGDPHTLCMSSQVSHMYLYDVFVKLKTVHWCEKTSIWLNIVSSPHCWYYVCMYVCMKYLEAYAARYLIKAIKTHNFVRAFNILFWVRFSSSVLALNMKI